MSFGEALKLGLAIVNRNWQLLLVNLVAGVINCLGFAVVVVLPLIVWAIASGMNPSILAQLRSPADMIGSFPGLILLCVFLIIVYISIVSALGLFVFAGSAGVLSRTVVDREKRFDLNEFFKNGRKLFFPLLAYISLVGLIAIVAVVAFVIFLFSVPALSLLVKGLPGPVSIAMTILIWAVAIFTFLICFFGIISIIQYGVARIIFKGKGAVVTLKDTVSYLMRQPTAFAMYVIATLIYAVVGLLVVLIGIPMQMTSGVGSIMLEIPYQMLAFAVQSYGGLWTLAVVLVYYYGTEISVAENRVMQEETLDGR